MDLTCNKNIDREEVVKYINRLDKFLKHPMDVPERFAFLKEKRSNENKSNIEEEDSNIQLNTDRNRVLQDLNIDRNIDRNRFSISGVEFKMTEINYDCIRMRGGSCESTVNFSPLYWQ
jgi:hypothetical protein